MKRLISALLAAAVLLTPIPAGVVSALPDEYIDYDGPQYWEDEEGYTHFACFGSPSQSPTSFTVPDDVEIIDAYAFSGTNVRTVVLPDSVVMMEDFAFSSSQVQSITVGAGLAKADGLMGCYSLRSITVSPDNPYLRSEGNCVIDRQSNVLVLGCSQSVIPDDGSITGIAPYAFHRNSPSVVSIPDGVEWIGEEAFSGSVSRLSYLSKITFPDSLKSIDKRAFYNCDTLASVTLPDHVMEIGAAAFEGTKYYNTAANWTDNVLYIGKHAIAATIAGDGAIKEGTLSIAAQAFSGCGEATSITLPESVQYIGPRAFLNCRSLMRIKLPSQLTSIPTGLFYNCTGLVSVTFPPQVDSVGENAFYGCSSLIAVKLPDGVQSIGGEAFYGCTELRTITLPDGVTSVGDAAFEGTAYYNNADNWENDVLYIGRCLIKARTTLDGAYTVKDGTKYIATNAFKECKSLTDITIPRGVTHIGNGAFYDCVLLNGVILPAGVVSIGTGAFYCCSQMRAVVALDGLTAIGDQAFYRCLSLSAISLPASVVAVGAGAFYYCASLENVYYSGTENNKSSMTVANDNVPLTDAVWHYEQELCPQHVWKNACDTECDLCGGEREVPHIWANRCDTACDLCGAVRVTVHAAVTIPPQPPTCTEDGLTAGERCGECGEVLTAQESVPATGHAMVADALIPPTCTEEGLAAGEHCERCGMSPVARESIPASGHVYDTAADETCNVCGELRFYVYKVVNGEAVVTAVSTEIAGEITIPETLNGYPVTAISDGAFRGCENITVLTLPAAIRAVGEGAFYGCANLHTVYWHAVTCTVSDGTTPLFAACESLRYVHIASGVQYVPAYAFVGATVTTVSFATGVERIGAYAFSGCAALRMVTLPEGVLAVEEGAFRGCDAIETVILPASLEKLGDYAFMSCKNLRGITVGKGLCDVGYATFLGCDALCEVQYDGTPDTRASIRCGTENTPFIAAVWRYGLMMGDVDGSGRVDSTDARLVLQYAVGKIDGERLNLIAADVDGSKKTDSTDARLVLQFAVEKIAQFPAA